MKPISGANNYNEMRSRFFRLLCAIVMLMLSLHTSAQKRHALLIGISQYGEETGWSAIHGTNDVDLMKMVLKDFSVVELRNAGATYSNIIMQLKKLEKKVNRGDIVYIHLSGHGQPYEDLDGDEPDGWDEAFVPYDAHLYYEAGKYTGEKHLTDDILNIYFNAIRRKIGELGMLYVVNDACHAGCSYRKANGNIFRGTSKGFSKNHRLYKVQRVQKSNYTIHPIKGYAPIVMLEACQSYERNMEIKVENTYYGPLTYAIYTMLRNKRLDKDTRWIKGIPSIMHSLLPPWNRQKMVIETSLNQ